MDEEKMEEERKSFQRIITAFMFYRYMFADDLIQKKYQ